MDSTGCLDVLGREIRKGYYIKTQIDGLLPKWYEGEIIFERGCFGMKIENHFEPMCWFLNMLIKD